MELLNLVPRPPAVGHNLLDSIARSILSFGLGQIFQRAAPLGNTAVEGMATVVTFVDPSAHVETILHNGKPAADTASRAGRPEVRPNSPRP